jgi:hypothetical protein
MYCKQPVADTWEENVSQCWRKVTMFCKTCKDYFCDSCGETCVTEGHEIERVE